MIPVHAAEGVRPKALFGHPAEEIPVDQPYRAVNLQDVADPQTLWDTVLEGEAFPDVADTPEGPSSPKEEA